jgi:NitT/TauT family transport system substrate-binding protein
MLTLDELLRLRDQGLALEIVLVFDVSRGADMLLARPGVRTLAALRQRRIGVEDTALGTLLLTLVLERAGLRREDVVVHRIAYERHEAAWLGNEVDALITYEPVAGRLGAHGARQLLSSRQLPDTIFDVLAVRSDVLGRHGETLREGLAAYFKALDYLRQNPWDAAYRVAPRLQVSAEGMIESLRGLELPDRIGNLRYLAGADSPLLQAALRLSPIMQQAGLLSRPVDTRQLLTSAYLPRP